MEDKRRELLLPPLENKNKKTQLSPFFTSQMRGLGDTNRNEDVAWFTTAQSRVKKLCFVVQNSRESHERNRGPAQALFIPDLRGQVWLLPTETEAIDHTASPRQWCLWWHLAGLWPITSLITVFWDHLEPCLQDAELWLVSKPCPYPSLPPRVV